MVRRYRLDDYEEERSTVIADHIAAAEAVGNRNLDTLLRRCDEGRIEAKMVK